MSPYTLPILGRLAWIDVVLLGWFLLVFISVVFVAQDAFTHLPEPTCHQMGLGPDHALPRPGRRRVLYPGR